MLFLGTSIKAGRMWRTDSLRRKQSFRAFNSLYCKSACFSELILQQLTERFCSADVQPCYADKLSKTEYHQIEYAWNAMMYKYMLSLGTQ